MVLISTFFFIFALIVLEDYNCNNNKKIEKGNLRTITFGFFCSTNFVRDFHNI